MPHSGVRHRRSTGWLLRDDRQAGPTFLTRLYSIAARPIWVIRGPAGDGRTFARMVSPPSNPHDAYFRCVMARPVDAASEIRAALPAAIAAELDLATLHLQPGSFVSRELRSRYSDLLYSVQFDGRDAYLYV